MAKVQFRSGRYYHVYNRGVNRSAIFFDQENYAFFIRRMRHYFQPELVHIIAYCLMPTHYHLLVQTQTDDEFGSKVMQSFGTSYVKAINKQQDRVGPLFQGKYNDKLVDTDAYLSHLTRYIHRNPVDAGYVAQVEEWPYSSYRDYVGLRDGVIPHSDIILEHFSSVAEYRAFVEAGGEQAPVGFLGWLDDPEV